MKVESEDPTVSQMVLRISVAAVALLILDVLFWLTADFQSFIPPSEGTTPERLYLAAVTASGPFAMVILGNVMHLAFSVAFACGLVGILVGAAIRWRRFAAIRLAAYVGVFLWFFFGFAVAGLRIT